MGYITIAYTIGMTNGTSATTFSPDNTATRAQAAAMLVRIYEKISAPTDFVHGFYAISSYSQLHLAEEMDAVSAGWSRMTWDGETALLSTTSANGNEYAVPSGYQEVTAALESRDVLLHLSVFMDGQELKDLLASETGRTQAVEQIVHEVTVDYQVIGREPLQRRHHRLRGAAERPAGGLHRLPDGSWTAELEAAGQRPVRLCVPDPGGGL